MVDVLIGSGTTKIGMRIETTIVGDEDRDDDRDNDGGGFEVKLALGHEKLSG